MSPDTEGYCGHTSGGESRWNKVTDHCENCGAAVCDECFEDGADRGGDRRIGDLLTATPLLCLKCAVAVGTPR